MERINVVKFILGLLKTIEEVVELWRRGDKNLDCQPLRKFADSEMRKKMVANYSHQIWTLSGQKNSFPSIKDLVERVQGFGPVRICLMDVGSDDDCEQDFMQCWIKMGGARRYHVYCLKRLNKNLITALVYCRGRLLPHLSHLMFCS